MKRKAPRLSREESKIEKTLDEGEWTSAPEAEIGRYVKMAKAFTRAAIKEGRVNIRIAEKDITRLKKIADSEGLPYQTLMASVIHKYVNGLLVDRKLLSELKAIVRTGR
ncbi:MAG: antitoxin [Nitrospinae bacterium]|nr:antitoxin [Nitrospinota bacterium]